MSVDEIIRFDMWTKNNDYLVMKFNIY